MDTGQPERRTQNTIAAYYVNWSSRQSNELSPQSEPNAINTLSPANRQFHKRQQITNKLNPKTKLPGLSIRLAGQPQKRDNKISMLGRVKHNSRNRLTNPPIPPTPRPNLKTAKNLP